MLGISQSTRYFFVASCAIYIENAIINFCSRKYEKSNGKPNSHIIWSRTQESASVSHKCRTLRAASGAKGIAMLEIGISKSTRKCFARNITNIFCGGRWGKRVEGNVEALVLWEQLGWKWHTMKLHLCLPAVQIFYSYEHG